MPLSSLPQRQTFTSATGHTYSYIYIPTQALTKQTLLLLHGFPSHIPDWINQVSYFSTLGYGILALDLLGYGQSSQPSDVNAYRFKPMGSEIVELLNVLKLSKVVGVGHDFGAALLSRLITYNPERFEKAVFLAVGPPRPNTPFKVDEINTMTKKMLGYEMLGYIPWLASDPTSQQALERNAESAMSLMFCSDKREWDQWFHPLGKMKEFVEGGRRVSVKRWFGDELQAAHVEAFGRKDGYKGVRMWYGMWMRELFAEDEKGFEDFQLKQPVLFVVPKDPPGSAEQQKGFLKVWCSDLKTVGVDGGHWVHLESANATNEAIKEFLEKS